MEAMANRQSELAGFRSVRARWLLSDRLSGGVKHGRGTRVGSRHHRSAIIGAREYRNLQTSPDSICTDTTPMPVPVIGQIHSPPSC
jgi:hypothetical protein